MPPKSETGSSVNLSRRRSCGKVGNARGVFQVGGAHVICSMDYGFSWFPVLNSIAVPGIPESGFFDPVSNPFDRAFYVECQGRSVLRIGNLPNPPSIQPSPIFDLMEFAALDY